MNEHEESLDLKTLFRVFINHIIPIAIITILAGALSFCLSAFVISKQYTSEALMYVENSSNKTEDAININDISAAQKLVNTCQILFTSDYIFQQLNESLGADWSNEELKKMISVKSVNSTEVMRISVVTENPSLSVTIADKLVELSKNEFMRVIKNGSIEVVSSASYPETHTFPNPVIFTAAGMLIGLCLSYVVFLLMELLDTRVKPEDDLAQLYSIPVFAEIMDFESAQKHGYKYDSAYVASDKQ